MPKVVTDKEKIERLTKALKDQKEESKKEISELKKVCRALKAKVRYLSGKQSFDVSINAKEVDIIKKEYDKVVKERNDISESIQPLKSMNEQLCTENDKLKERISQLERTVSFYESQPQKADNRLEMVGFIKGKPCDSDGNLFFSHEDLIIRINPITGDALTDSEHEDILQYLLSKSKEKYAEYLKRIREYQNGLFAKDRKSLHNGCPTDLWTYPDMKYLDNLGRELYKDYVQIFYGY